MKNYIAIIALSLIASKSFGEAKKSKEHSPIKEDNFLGLPTANVDRDKLLNFLYLSEISNYYSTLPRETADSIVLALENTCETSSSEENEMCHNLNSKILFFDSYYDKCYSHTITNDKEINICMSPLPTTKYLYLGKHQYCLNSIELAAPKSKPFSEKTSKILIQKMKSFAINTNLDFAINNNDIINHKKPNGYILIEEYAGIIDKITYTDEMCQKKAIKNQGNRSGN